MHNAENRGALEELSQLCDGRPNREPQERLIFLKIPSCRFHPFGETRYLEVLGPNGGQIRNQNDIRTPRTCDQQIAQIIEGKPICENAYVYPLLPTEHSLMQLMRLLQIYEGEDMNITIGAFCIDMQRLLMNRTCGIYTIFTTQDLTK